MIEVLVAWIGSMAVMAFLFFVVPQFGRKWHS